MFRVVTSTVSLTADVSESEYASTKETGRSSGEYSPSDTFELDGA